VKRILLAGVSAAFLVGACADASGPSTDGTLRVELTGFIADVFQASGPYPDSGFPTETFAAARPTAVPGTLAILAARVEGDAEDGIVLEVRDYEGPGTHAALGVVRYGNQFFEIVAGEIDISEGTSARVRGTFSGTAVSAVRFPGLGVPPDTVHLMNGVFDVPIVATSQ
jgi:hypothetical protein